MNARLESIISCNSNDNDIFFSAAGLNTGGYRSLSLFFFEHETDFHRDLVM